ncbi:MAG: hypothetical protein ACFCVH_01475 [Alphaproteobacteria bacterium]
MARSCLAPILLLAALAVPAAAADIHGRMLPVDEGPRDPEFAAFRAELLDAIARMDAEYVLSITPETLDTGSLIDEYGADLGRRALELGWMPQAVPIEQWDLWPALAGILENGGRFVEPGKFCAPYFHTELTEALATDPDYRYGVVTADQLTVYMHPTTATYVLGQAELGDILQLVNPGGMDVPDREDASAVRFEAIWFGDQPAYADTAAIHRLGGLYACFAKDRILDRWQMISFGAPRGRE